MKNTFLNLSLVLATLFAPLSAFCQVDHGAILSFFGGGAYNYSPRLQSELNTSQYAGSGLNLNGIAETFGGELTIVTHKNVIVNLNGYGYGLSSNGTNGNVKEKTGAGIIDIGYSFAKKKKHLSYPYIGIGGFGTKFIFTNNTTKNILLGEEPTLPGLSNPFSTGGFAYEAGYSYKYYAFKTQGRHLKRYGGVIGFDIGCQYYMAMGKWRNTNVHNILGDFDRPLIVSPYLRITLGIADLSNKIWTKKG